MIKPMYWVLVVLAGIAVLIAGFVLLNEDDSDALTVYAAASLTDAFREVGTAFEQANPGTTVRFSFAGSSTLATQIQEGASADVFASANPIQMQNVVDAGLAPADPPVFAHNRLVIITPADNPAEISAPGDLVRDDLSLVLATDGVPVRAYTDEMFTRMSDSGAYPEDFTAQVMDNLVSAEPDVRAVVARIANGEADAGVVYSSDVTPDVADGLNVIDVPERFNPRASYPVAVLNDAANTEAASDFVVFLRSEDGQAILSRWGFLPTEKGDGE